MKKLTIGIAGSFRYDAHPHAAIQKKRSRPAGTARIHAKPDGRG